MNDKSYYNTVFSVLPCLSNWLWSNVCNMYVTERSFRKNDLLATTQLTFIRPGKCCLNI